MIFYHFETGMFGFIVPKNDTCLSRWPGYEKTIYKTSAQGVTYRQVLTGGICNTSSISNSHGLPRSCTLIVSHRLLTSPTQLTLIGFLPSHASDGLQSVLTHFFFSRSGCYPSHAKACMLYFPGVHSKATQSKTRLVRPLSSLTLSAL